MKSGTSLLRVLLGQHPNLFATFESHWFSDELRNDWMNFESHRVKLLMQLFELTRNEYQSLCIEKISNNNVEFIDIVYRYCAKRAHKSRWVDKTPYNIKYFDVITREWPGAVLIHVTREYKDTFASWKVRRGDDINTFLDWSLVAYEQIRPLMGTEQQNYLEVDYFDLVVNSEHTMRRVLEKIGEPWDAACSQIVVKDTEEERIKIKNIIKRESLTSVSLAKPIFTDSICQWKRLISKGEANIIDKEFAPYYAIYGQRWKRYDQYCQGAGNSTRTR
ncbi:MAG: hypothetical protein ACD_23C00315G0005 [uncultured bacterium]|nr:MAG: hypothetical protein ACD_23C00315G0005 [uncultured bacterium]